MVHAHDGFAQTRSQRRRKTRPREQSARQTGAARVANGIDLRQRFAACRQHLAQQRHQALQVVAAGQLGHHAAIGLVHGHLAVQRVGQQHGRASLLHIYQGNAGLITRGFKAQKQHGLTI